MRVADCGVLGDRRRRAPTRRSSTAEQPIRIARIQLVELWEDRALQAVDALAELARRTATSRVVSTFDG